MAREGAAEYDAPIGPPTMKRLKDIEPLLPSQPDVVYDYTIPELTRRTLLAIRRRHADHGPVYMGYKQPNRSIEAPEDRFVALLDAAKLIAGLYSHFLDPLRVRGDDAGKPDKETIINGFARTLAGARVLPSVELVAENIGVLRSVDEYQDGVGTNAARWMQYLAFEALQANVMKRGYTTGRELERLRAALTTIRDSATVLDRFKALSNL